MDRKTQLTPHITEAEFDNGYWYAIELKIFAKELGIADTGKLRKNELEDLVRHYIRTGKTQQSGRPGLQQAGEKDYELGLRLDMPIVNYTSNKVTKQFIEAQAEKLSPGLKKRSGARYRLNRWREEQLAKGKRVTYHDLVNEYIRLNSASEPFEKIPQVRYINFLAEYMAHEQVSRAQAIKDWKELKELDIPKTYAAWKTYKRKKQ